MNVRTETLSKYKWVFRVFFHKKIDLQVKTGMETVRTT